MLVWINIVDVPMTAVSARPLKELGLVLEKHQQPEPVAFVPLWAMTAVHVPPAATKVGESVNQLRLIIKLV